MFRFFFTLVENKEKPEHVLRFWIQDD